MLVNTTTIWRTALERLEHTSIDAVSKTWLQEAHLATLPHIGSDDMDAPTIVGQEQEVYLTLQLPNDQAYNVINTRWRRPIEEILADLTGQSVLLSVTHKPAEDVPDALPTNGREALERASFSSTPKNTYSYYDVQPAMSAQSSHPQPDPRYMDTGASDSLEDWDNEQRANILMHNRLNPRYTFDAFIVGNSNRLAHAASLAVAEAPGESYNPLFLYGGVGLGKTHLLHAIGHQGVHTGLAVLYVSSEQFTNDIVNAIRYRTTEEFRAKYRSVDILLVDDIQFIAGKESTEEEFFHTFNSLHEMSKQIVICSDRPPKAIVSLEERLRSRFEWGLIADIQPPDLETRMAILRVKADILHYRVPDDIISYIAGRVQTNIRELEGCLNRLMAYQQLHRTDLTMDVARAAMSSLGNDTRETRLNSRQIAQAVAEYYRISMEAMCGKQRDKYIVMPRQIAMYLIRQETQTSLLEIGQLFGGRDHSTVLHACEKIDREINVNPTLRREVIAIREQLMRE
jgi:chromosomal replication initiator protein